MSLSDHAVELALSNGWDEEPDAVWEPWVPVLGQRVMLRFSGECPVRRSMWTPRHDGIQGVVIHVFDVGPREPAHRFKVKLDAGMTATAAACELVPIQPAEDADGARGREVPG